MEVKEGRKEGKKESKLPSHGLRLREGFGENGHAAEGESA